MTPLRELNFPDYNYKLKEENQKHLIWDIIREAWVVLTPEEWVRQNLIHYFIDHLGYPRGLMNVESKITVHGKEKRFDLVVMSHNLDPWLLCECKAPDVKISDATLHQASQYNFSLKCPYLAVTNGLDHFCFLIDFDSSSTQKLTEFPSFQHPNN